MPAAWSLPTGYQSVAGNVSFSLGDKTLNVSTGAQKSIANYQSFNIAADETVNFHLPGAHSVILNRVLGGDPSSIFGRLNSNGEVFLVNPNGILFGPSAQVNVGSLFASTLDIKNEDFLNGQYVFIQSPDLSPAKITNQGEIRVQPGGYGILAAGAIENTGLISAPQGQIHLAVGQQTRLKVDDFLAVDVLVDKPLQQKVDGVQTAILNQGTLQADDGLIRLNAQLNQNLYDKAVNNQGIVEARGFARHGGTVEFFGDRLVENHGAVDVRGTASAPDGGTVTMSGTQVKQDGLIDAGADTLNGNGGQVNIQSDQLTDLSGAIHADAGQQSGDGGMIELSSRNMVKLNGTLSAAGYKGKAGTILIDPTNVRITNLSLNAGSSNIPASDPDNGAGESTFDPASFSGFSNVNIEATNDISVESPFALNGVTAGNNLSLRAGNDINILSALSTSGGNIQLIADANLTGSGGTGSNGVGTLTIANTGSVNSNGGNITLQGAQINLQGGALAQSGSVVAGNGNVTVSGQGAQLSLTGGNGTESGSILTNGNFSFQGDSIRLTGGAGDRSGSILAGGNVTLNAVGIPFLGPDGMSFDDTGSTVFTPCGDDCASGPVNFGFNFNFFGSSVSSGEIITNGFLWMGNNGSTPIAFPGFPVNDGTGKIALFQADLNPDLGGSIGYLGTGAEFFTTFRDVQDVNGAGVLNGQIGLLNAGNSLGLHQGTIVLSYGSTQTTTYNTTATGVGLNAGNGSGFQTLNSLGIGSTGGQVTDIQLRNSLAGRSFAFVPNGSGGYTVTELSRGTGGGLSLVGGGGLSSGSIVSSAGNISLNTNGNILLNAGGGADSGSLITNGAGSGINLTTGQLIRLGAGSKIRTNNGPISLESLSLDLGGTLDAGTSTIVLNPYDSVDTMVADNADSDGDDAVYDVNTAELGNITAGTLQIGNTARTGNMTLNGNVNLSGAGPAGAYNLSLNTGGNYTATGQTVTSGDKNFSVTAGGTLNTGTVTGGASDVSFSAGDTLTVDGNLTTNAAGSVNLATTSNDNIALGADVSSGDVIIAANGSGSITQSAGTITGTNVTLSSGTGDIGAAASSQIHTDADTLRATTGGSGDVFIADVGSVTIGTSAAGGRFQLETLDSITTSGALTANDVILKTTANNGNITLGANVTGSNSVLLSTDGSGNITRTGGRVNGSLLTLLSTSGNFNLNTDIASLAGSTTGDITLSDAGNFVIDAANLSGNDITLSSAGSLTTVGAISGRNVKLLTGGSIFDGNGNALDLTATAGATLQAGGVIGGLGDPFDVLVTGGPLRVSAFDQLNFISIDINGSVAPIDTLTLLNIPPGDVIYNGRRLAKGELVKRVERSLVAMNAIGQPYMAAIGREPSTRLHTENRIVDSYILNDGSPKLVDSPATRRVNLPISGVLMK